jgi:hypothetical protein
MKSNYNQILVWISNEYVWRWEWFHAISANWNYSGKKNNYLHDSLLCDKFVYYDEMFLFRLIEPIFPQKFFR